MDNSVKNVLMVCIITSVLFICVYCLFCFIKNLLNKLLCKNDDASNENDYIRQYLDSYIKRDKPGYAVLLKGPWGSGKTYFIQNYEIKNNNKRLCYISLFGVSNKSELELRLWKGLIFDYPYIAIKRFFFFFLISNLILMLYWYYESEIFLYLITKYSNQVDIVLSFFDGFISSPLFTSVLGVFSIITTIVLFVWKFTRFNAMELLLRECVLVLDDFERVEASCDEVFSWINEFVEHVNCHVVLIGNEKEIEEKLNFVNIHKTITNRNKKNNNLFIVVLKCLHDHL